MDVKIVRVELSMKIACAHFAFYNPSSTRIDRFRLLQTFWLFHGGVYNICINIYIRIYFTHLNGRKRKNIYIYIIRPVYLCPNLNCKCSVLFFFCAYSVLCQYIFFSLLLFVYHERAVYLLSFVLTFDIEKVQL